MSHPALHLTLKAIGVIFLASLLTGCKTSTSSNTATSAPADTTTTSPTRSAAMKVVATTSVLCDLTQAIAQQTIDLTCPVQGGVDPHVYQPSPEDRKAIETADLILYGGYNFEPALIKLVKSTSNPAPKVAVHETAVPKPLILKEGHEHQHEVTDEHGHETEVKAEKEAASQGTAEPDPHVWHNVQNTIRMVDVIQAELTKLAPGSASLYQQNAQTLTQQLDKLDAWVKSQIATIPAQSRKLITTHDALGYYATAYGIPVEGALLGISTDEKPTASRIKALVDEIHAANVPTIFAEVSVNPKLIETVAKDAKVTLSTQELFTDGLGAPGSGAETYPKMIAANTEAIVKGLGGRFEPFP